MRNWDIRVVILTGLGAVAYGLVFLLQNFGLNNVPDENVVYVDPAVGGVEDDEPLDGAENAAEIAESERPD